MIKTVLVYSEKENCNACGDVFIGITKIFLEPPVDGRMVIKLCSKCESELKGMLIQND